MFWVWIGVLVLVVIGASVLVGRSLNKSNARRLSRQEQITALKASGAMRHRKESRR